MASAYRDWDAYDALIQSEIGECACSERATAYNPRFIENVASGYVCVDWMLIKAMLWVESGGPRQASWKIRPMQIGNPGDPANGVLKKSAEGSALVMSPALAAAIRTQSIDSPELNIRAAIAYLFTRMAKFDVRSVVDESDKTIHTVFIGNGVVLDAHHLLSEIRTLEAGGIKVRDRLRVSPGCPLILGYHAALDRAREAAKSAGEKRGSTR